MKKLSALLLCLVLCLSCVAILASCDTGSTTPDTEPTTTAPENDATDAPTEAPTDEGGDDATEAPTDDDENSGSIYDEELVVSIGTAEELMAFNKAVNEDGEYFDDKIILLTADIDMTGYTWVALDGLCLYNVTFDGQGHTISNLQFADYEYEEGMAPPNGEKGYGFVNAVASDMIFKNLTFDNTKATAYDQAVGNFVGSIRDGFVSFENCKSLNFTVDGWMDWNNQKKEEGGHSIAMRLAGFVGHVLGGGMVSFTDCSVENIKLSGFHNMAGFVGYDGSSSVDQFTFENCSVKNAEFTFSYCLSENYTIDQPRKFVSVFYNSSNWVDNIDLVADPELGNSYENVSFYDYTNENAEYTPADFRSWTQEEADGAANG